MLLLVLPASAFKAIVPVFIAIALVLTVLQPRLNAWLLKREINLERRGGILTALAVYATGVYGGYFGAAQGILLLAILGVALSQDLQRTNALKNVLAGLVNGVAGVYFAFAAHVAWAPAGIIACASILGAQLGAHYGRRLPPRALRAVIVLVGILAIVRLGRLIAHAQTGVGQEPGSVAALAGAKLLLVQLGDERVDDHQADEHDEHPQCPQARGGARAERRLAAPAGRSPPRTDRARGT